MDIDFCENYDLKKCTAFKVGGSVDKAYFPKNRDEIVYLLSNLTNYLVLGNCSNILASSSGIKENVIFTKNMTDILVEGTVVVCDSGVKGPTFSKVMEQHSLSGAEFMIGFPGSVGGNVYMNASAHNQSISDYFVSADVFDCETKTIKTILKNDMDFSYRSSVLNKKQMIVLSAKFDFEKKEKSLISSRMQENLHFRKSHQPLLKLPNCGSVFKNPENNSAGMLLDDVGVKNLAVGGAKVWENHANFIVNYNNATSYDVLSLMLMMYNRVKDKYSIELSPEVKYVGDKSEKEDLICKILYKK